MSEGPGGYDDDRYESPEVAGNVYLTEEELQQQEQQRSQAHDVSDDDEDEDDGFGVAAAAPSLPGGGRAYPQTSQNKYVGEQWTDKVIPGSGTKTEYPADAGTRLGLSLDQGRLTGEGGAAVDTTSATRLTAVAGSKSERHIVAMDADGNLFAADELAERVGQNVDEIARQMTGRIQGWGKLSDDEQRSTLLALIRAMAAQGPVRDSALGTRRFHHSSLVGGRDVAAAGEIKVRDGVVESVSDKSGHYKPDFSGTAQIHERLAVGGVDTSRVTYEMGRYAGHKFEGDTRVNGVELDAYLEELRAGLREDARGLARTRAEKESDDPAEQSRLAEQYFEAEWAAVRAAGSSREKLLAIKATIESRHEKARAALDEVRARGEAEWRADPTGRFVQRWWDGQGWTKHVKDATGRESVDRAELDEVRARGEAEWRADPTGRFVERWWGGQDWTKHVKDATGRESVDTVVPSTAGA